MIVENITHKKIAAIKSFDGGKLIEYTEKDGSVYLAPENRLEVVDFNGRYIDAVKKARNDNTKLYLVDRWELSRPQRTYLVQVGILDKHKDDDKPTRRTNRPD